MFVCKNYINCVWLLLLISFICLTNGRQIRYSRYNTEVIENVQVNQDSEKNINVHNNQTLDNENEIQASVREIKYPANGNRSMRAFPLSSETMTQTERSDVKAQITDETLSATTTETTKEYEDETTTVSDSIKVNTPNVDVNAEKNVPSDSAKPNAPYPAAGFKPKIPFALPTDNLQEKVGNAELTEQSNKTVLEIPIATDIKASYPAAGYRPSRAFVLPSERSDVKAQITDETLSATTTETTKEYEDETTTVSDSIKVNTPNVDVNAEKNVPSDSAKPNAPYPAAGFKPKIPFALPTDNLQEKVGNAELTEQSNKTVLEIPIATDIKASYPAAGYRPSRAFVLPSEQLLLENEQEVIKPKMLSSNSNHPPCGSSTNPLAPIPMEGEKEDPDSESIFANTQVQQKRAIVLPVRYAVHPLLLTRPLIYGTPTISGW